MHAWITWVLFLFRIRLPSMWCFVASNNFHLRFSTRILSMLFTIPFFSSLNRFPFSPCYLVVRFIRIFVSVLLFHHVTEFYVNLLVDVCVCVYSCLKWSTKAPYLYSWSLFSLPFGLFTCLCLFHLLSSIWFLLEWQHFIHYQNAIQHTSIENPTTSSSMKYARFSNRWIWLYVNVCVIHCLFRDSHSLLAVG